MGRRNARRSFEGLVWCIGLSKLPSRDKESELADWGEVFTVLVAHTNITWEEIGERSLPQIEAIMERLGKHISLIGITSGDAGREDSIEEKEDHTINDTMEFISLFS